MKRFTTALFLIGAIVCGVAGAGVRDVPSPIGVTSWSISGSAVTVNLVNDGQEDATAMLTVTVTTNGQTTGSFAMPVSVGGGGSGVVVFTITDDVYPFLQLDITISGG